MKIYDKSFMIKEPALVSDEDIEKDWFNTGTSVAENSAPLSASKRSLTERNFRVFENPPEQSTGCVSSSCILIELVTSLNIKHQYLLINAQ